MTVPEVKSVRLWRNNALTDEDTLERFPIVYLQYTNVNYESTAGKTQECNGALVTVHIIYKTLEPEDTGVMDISQAVYVAMHNAGFERKNEVPYYTGGELIDWQITFEAPRWIDEDAKGVKIRIPKPPVNIVIENY